MILLVSPSILFASIVVVFAVFANFSTTDARLAFFIAAFIFALNALDTRFDKFRFSYAKRFGYAFIEQHYALFVSLKNGNFFSMSASIRW